MGNYGAIEILLTLFFGLIGAVATGAVAKSKGRSPLGRGVLGFFFCLIPLVVVAVLPSQRGVQR